jgi:hypothetical protein
MSNYYGRVALLGREGGRADTNPVTGKKHGDAHMVLHLEIPTPRFDIYKVAIFFTPTQQAALAHSIQFDTPFTAEFELTKDGPNTLAADFDVKIPVWVTPTTITGRGVWIYGGFIGPDGDMVFERQAHGWSGNLVTLAGATFATSQIEVLTDNTKLSADLQWLTRNPVPDEALNHDLDMVHAYNEEVTAFWESDKYAKPKVAGVSKWEHSFVGYPLTGFTATLPMFSHLVPVTHTIPVHATKTVAYFNHITKLALQRLGFTDEQFRAAAGEPDGEDPIKQALYMELLSEVCTLPLCASEYTIDKQGNSFVDEWEFLTNRLRTEKVQRFDCEDGTEWIIRTIRTLHRIGGLFSGAAGLNPPSTCIPSLSQLCVFTAYYEPCMLICTLRTETAFTYHACAWVADRAWLEMHADAIDPTMATATGASAAHPSNDHFAGHVNAMGVISADDTEAEIFARRKMIHLKRKKEALENYRPSFIIEPTAYTQAARVGLRDLKLLAGSPDDEQKIENARTDMHQQLNQLISTDSTDAQEALDVDPVLMKMDNYEIYGVEGDHRYYGHALMVMAPYLLQRHIPELAFFSRDKPTMLSVPVQDLLDYRQSTRTVAPVESATHVILAIDRLMKRMPPFPPLQPSHDLTTTFTTVTAEERKTKVVVYCRDAEVTPQLREHDHSIAEVYHNAFIHQYVLPRHSRESLTNEVENMDFST